MPAIEPYRVVPEKFTSLDDLPTEDDGGFDKDDGKKAFEQLGERLTELQRLLFAEEKHKVLVVFCEVLQCFGNRNRIGVRKSDSRRPVHGLDEFIHILQHGQLLVEQGQGHHQHRRRRRRFRCHPRPAVHRLRIPLRQVERKNKNRHGRTGFAAFPQQRNRAPRRQRPGKPADHPKPFDAAGLPVREVQLPGLGDRLDVPHLPEQQQCGNRIGRASAGLRRPRRVLVDDLPLLVARSRVAFSFASHHISALWWFERVRRLLVQVRNYEFRDQFSRVIVSSRIPVAVDLPMELSSLFSSQPAKLLLEQ